MAINQNTFQEVSCNVMQKSFTFAKNEQKLLVLID